MGGKGSGRIGSTLTLKRAQEYLELAEGIVVDVLTGVEKVPPGDRAKLAFALVGKRIPTMTEEVGEGVVQNIINVIKTNGSNGTGRTERTQLGVQPETNTGS